MRTAMLPLERMSEPMQGLYADLRHQYPLAAITLTPEDGVMLLTFTDGPTVRISETPTGRFRVRATRQVPAGKRTKDVVAAKTAQDARAVLYAIDGFLVESPKTAGFERAIVAAVLEFRTLLAAPEAYEQIAHAFIDGLGAHPEQLSSRQLGDRLSRFIELTLPIRWDPRSVTTEMWADIGLLLEQHGIHMDERDFNAAIDQVS